MLSIYRLLPRRFSHQIALAVVLIFASAIVAYAAYTAHEQGEAAERQLLSQGETMASLLAGMLGGVSADAMPPRLQSLLDHVAGNPDTQAVELRDGAGELLAAGVNPGQVESLTAIRPPPAMPGIQRSPFGATEIWIEVKGQATPLWVRLELARERVDKIRRSVWLDGLVTGGLVSAGAIFILLLLLAPSMKVLRRAASFAAELDGRRGQQLPAFAGNEEFQHLIDALNRASQRLRQQESRIEEQNRFLKSLTEAIGDGILAADAEGRCTFINPEGERLLGWTREELLGRNLHDVIHRQTASGLAIDYAECPLHAPVAAMHPFRSDLDAFIRRDGTIFPISVVSVPLFEGERFTGSVVAFQDITSRRQDEDFLLSTSSRLSALIESMHSGVLLEDEHGVMVTANHAFFKLFEVDDLSMISVGELTRELFQTCSVNLESPADFLSTVDHVIGQGRAVSGVPLHLNGGRVLEFDYVPVYNFPLNPMPEDYRGHLWLFHDVTERTRVAEALRQARDAAESASRAKSDILANVSHEIRTPMNGIIGMTGLALDTELTHDQRQYLEMVHSSAEALLVLINDLLDFSKIEAGRMEIEHIGLSLSKLVRDSVKPLALRAAEKGLAVNVELAPALPAELIGDPGRLRQILINLVGNAIKFTEKGQIDVRVAVDSLDADEIVVHFSIRDTGIGIPAEKQSTIFEAFSQADNSITRRFGGTGLGLSICSELVRLMGGRIWVESQPGQGSNFQFTAKLGIGATKAALTADLPDEAAPGASVGALDILLAEDNPVNQKLAVALLSKRGHRVSVVENGALAVERISQQNFDLVLMDIQMPVLDGFEATARIRALETLHGGHLPIIAMTANAMSGDRERCLEAGMDDYVTKPIRIDELTAAISRQCQRSGNSGEKIG